ncbi:MAG TPA: hypothetical protein VFV95_02955 [Vicinamibacterales bacterium]|nr:hypothetical protein [Vicinamibacterales bacterium]
MVTTVSAEVGDGIATVFAVSIFVSQMVNGRTVVLPRTTFTAASKVPYVAPRP